MLMHRGRRLAVVVEGHEAEGLTPRLSLSEDAKSLVDDWSKDFLALNSPTSHAAKILSRFLGFVRDMSLSLC